MPNGLTLSAEFDGTHTMALAQDALGSTLADPGLPVEAADQDVFGQAASTPSSNVFLGHRAELTSRDGLVHLRARTYDSTAGGFLTPDPLDGLNGTATVSNRYHYANNDPTNLADPTGLTPSDSCMRPYEFKAYGACFNVVDLVEHLMNPIAIPAWGPNGMLAICAGASGLFSLASQRVLAAYENNYSSAGACLAYDGRDLYAAYSGGAGVGLGSSVASLSAGLLYTNARSVQGYSGWSRCAEVGLSVFGFELCLTVKSQSSKTATGIASVSISGSPIGLGLTQSAFEAHAVVSHTTTHRIAHWYADPLPHTWPVIGAIALSHVEIPHCIDIFGVPTPIFGLCPR